MDHDIVDPTRADEGRARIEWALGEMPVLRGLMEELAREQPLRGLRVSACLHVTTETANLVRTLAAGGASVRLCASNPLSTQDDVAASLVEHDGVPVFARHGVDAEGYYGHIEAAIAHGPQVTLDDGADLVTTLHTKHEDLLEAVIGGTEETTTGVIRLRAMEKAGALRYPIVAVNDADTKHLFDNRYGTGQSTLDGILRATNYLIAGRVFVVAGYGWCGRGIARRARGMGAHVVVTEVEPVRALEAVMDGFRVLPMDEAVGIAEFVVTATGDAGVVARRHFEGARDGCVFANSGHFDVEVDVKGLRELARSVTRPRASVESFVLADGRTLHLLAEGRLVNLAAAEGHPAAVMDMSFANQALVVRELAQREQPLPAGVHRVPKSIDAEVARRKLAAMEVAIDELSDAQRAYLDSWTGGT